MATEVYVKEYIQVGHRLIDLPGKCQQIHGHSMLITMGLQGRVDANGYLIDDKGEVMDFSAVKKSFRGHLGDLYDHHLLLNKDDPLLELKLPGVIKCDGDPCVENIAMWIYEEMLTLFHLPVKYIQVDETATNGVRYDGN